MKRTSCEYLFWNIIPAIRGEIARSMINDLGLTQKEAAAKLEITPAAVCQYLSDKRGNINIKEEKIIKEIKISAENLIKDDKVDISDETCRICKIIKSMGVFPFFNSRTKDRAGNLILCKL